MPGDQRSGDVSGCRRRAHRGQAHVRGAFNLIRLPARPIPGPITAPVTGPIPGPLTGLFATLLLFSLLLISLFLGGCQDDPPPAPEPAPEEEVELLPGDDELATPPLPGAPVEQSVWTDWIGGNHVVIRSLTSGNFADLEALRPHLEPYSIIGLGESGHGVAEFSEAKVRLIRYLHEELGYDVIAFESGLYDCWAADQILPELEPARAMGKSIFGVWYAEEVLPLFSYLRETRNTARPLRLAGFDIQISGGAALARYAFFEEVASHIDPAFARRVAVMDSSLVAELKRGYVSWSQYVFDHRLRLEAGYDSLYALLTSHQEMLRAWYPECEIKPELAARSAWCARKHIQLTMVPVDHPEDETYAYRLRDEAMYQNLVFLLSRLHPGARIILWAHNSHLRQQNGAIRGWANLGEMIHRFHRGQYCAIGLFMLRGQAATNARQVYDVAPLAARSLESIAYAARKKYLYLATGGHPEVPGNSWLRSTSITAREWGLYDVPHDLGAQYDGLLVIDTVSPPEYLGAKSADDGLAVAPAGFAMEP